MTDIRLWLSIHVLVDGDIDGNGNTAFHIQVHNLTADLQSLGKGDFML